MIGRTIGQLEIKRQVGQGGMGAVYYAEHALLRTPRAIKVLLPEWTRHEMMARRFLNEARAAARIKHRNVIDVHDCGQLEDGTLYIVMDYLEGETLSQCCRSYGGPIPLEHVLRLLAPVANGLEAAHAAGIVHRDLKPDNVLLVTREQHRRHPVIVDFGISKLGDEGGAMTRTGMVAGTPIYMSPEQMRDLKTADIRSHVYALGLIAYQMVTGGWLPYQDANEYYAQYTELSAAEIYHRQMSRSPIDPRQRNPAVTDRCAMAILAAIDVSPEKRQSSRGFMLQLAESVEGGIDIVRECAKELLASDDVLAPAPRPSIVAPTRGRVSRYEIGPRLGVGGMAEVFRATAFGAEGFTRSVALKRVLSGYAATPRFASMFVQEAQLAAQLSHANVVSVLDFDRDAEGRLFLVMEWVDGVDLATLADTGMLPFSLVIFVITEILRGLGYAHELPLDGSVRGVIHRDVSPHNVLLSWDGAVKVSDFGIAKARHATAATATDVVKGKPAYMSPEQANAEPLDGRSDLFAVGIIAWGLVTGRQLFDAVTTNGVIAQVLFKDIERPSRVRPCVPRDLDAVVMRLLERDLAKRYQTAVAAIEDLWRCASAPRDGRSELARVMAERFSHPQLPAKSATMGSAAIQPNLHRPARRWALIATATVALAGMAVLASTLHERGSERTPARSHPDTVPIPLATSSAEPAPMPVQNITITVATDPAGAAIVIDGTSRGTTPITMTATRGSRIAIEAHLTGHRSSSTTIMAEHEGQRVELKLPVSAPPRVDAAEPPKKIPSKVRTEIRSSKKPRPEAGTTPADEFDPDSVGGER